MIHCQSTRRIYPNRFPFENSVNQLHLIPQTGFKCIQLPAGWCNRVLCCSSWRRPLCVQSNIDSSSRFPSSFDSGNRGYFQRFCFRIFHFWSMKGHRPDRCLSSRRRCPLWWSLILSGRSWFGKIPLELSCRWTYRRRWSCLKLSKFN